MFRLFLTSGPDTTESETVDVDTSVKYKIGSDAEGQCSSVNGCPGGHFLWLRPVQ